MRHADAYRDFRRHTALEPSACEGELEPVDSWPDLHYDGGQFLNRVVSVYRCAGCRRRLSVAQVVGQESGQPIGQAEVLNEYGDPRELVVGLAQTFGRGVGNGAPEV